LRSRLIDFHHAPGLTRPTFLTGLLVVGMTLAAAATAAVQPKVENPHGRFKGDCGLCHGANGWKPAKISPQFNHASFGFPLTGAHSSAKCAACHSSLDFSQGKQLCASCHQDPHRGEMGTDCARCHSARSFVDRSSMVRQHQATRFPLTGSHAQIDCENCHKPTAQGQMQFVGTKAECQNCHMDAYKSTTNPDHQAGGFPLDCASCHSTLTWSTKTFDHNKTAFPLTGAHRATACAGCHGDGVYKGKTTDCYGCHKADYDRTTNPGHAASGFPITCTTCHSTVAWTTATFDHSKTAFPLTGAHASAQCSQCHGDGVYKGKATDCYSCHKTEYTGTNNPAHAASGFGTNCATCHTTVTWTGAAFNHNTMTTFPLTGAHIPLACNQCHGDGVYQGKSTACVSCHQTDYNGATPNHPASGFGTDCTTCHNTTTFAGAVFDHSKTAFPLTGAHAAVACNQCHGDGVYQGKSTLCYSCHKTDYDGTTDPRHGAAAFATTCENCHGTTVWTTSTFSHSTATTFPLTGAHLALDCNSCHSDNVFKGKSTLCYSCHQADYTGATNPAHASAGFPTNCETCHSTANWTSSTFNHNTSTSFPLTGAHQAVACNGCHGDNVYKGKSTLCVSCHQTDFNGTTDPKHSAATSTFVSTCESCHNTTSWTTSTFNHTTATTFPLTGAHITLDCNSCHGDNAYKGKSTLCYSCHQADYNTTVVNHAAAGFNTTCETCHTTTAWSGGKYTAHDTQFPIYSGRHLGKWSSCVDCHTNTTNYAIWSCVNSSCHTNTATDSTHRSKPNAINLCYSCHPRGTT
jgi:hypothetical protein